MPIGWDTGGAGAPGPPPVPIGDGTDQIGGGTDQFTPPEIEVEPLFPIVWTRWQTMEDERVCPECGPLDGLAWEETDGPMPPLHGNCRCTRTYAFTEYRTRT